MSEESVSVKVICSHCLAENARVWARCLGCGAALAEAALVAGDEIRQAAVLFADVADFTALSAQLPLEQTKRLMDRVFERLYRVVLDHGGVVDKYIGDCLMALFGVPLTRGEDGAQAVRAALEMQRAVKELARELQGKGLPVIRVRIAVNAGPVIAGPVGAGPQRRYTVMGPVVNLAAHLQQEAPVGSVLLGEGSYREVRALFRLEPHETQSGLAYLVRGERFGRRWLRPRQLLAPGSEIVGREGQLARLEGLFSQLRSAPQTRMALLVGGAGIGKTRLAFEFLSRLAESDAVLTLVGQAHPMARGTPFALVADVLRRKLDLPPEGQGRLRRLEALLSLAGEGRSGADLEVLTAILEPPKRPEDAPGGPERFVQRAFELSARLLARLAARRPVVCVIDELRHADGSSLQLLGYLLRRLEGQPLFILGTVRPEFLEQHPELSHAEAVEAIELSGLEEAQIARMVTGALGEQASAQVAGVVTRGAEGNPRHAEELLRTLRDSGVLRRQLGGWEVRAEAAPALGVESAARLRIEHLSQHQRALLRAAAVVGRTFWDGAVAAVLGDGAGVELGLALLGQRALASRRSESRFADQTEYAFASEAAREIAYESLDPQTRRLFHLRTARWLRQRERRGEAELALAAQHLERAGQPDEARVLYGSAADAAHLAASYQAADAHYRRAIELARGDEAALFSLLARRERVLNALGKWREQLQEASRLLVLARRGGEERLLLEALLRVGRAELNLGHHEAAQAALEEAEVFCAKMDDEAAHARVLRWRAMVHFNRGEHRLALTLFERALDFAARAGRQDLEAELAYELGVTMGTVGDYCRALEVSRRALEVFRARENRYQQAFCLGNMGCFHTYLGEYAVARGLLEEAVALGQELSAPLAEASARANYGNTLLALARPDEAAAEQERGRQLAERIGDKQLVADTLVYQARAEISHDSEEGWAAARRLTEMALSKAREAGLSSAEASALGLKARCVWREGRAGEGLSLARQAVRILDEMGGIEGADHQIRHVLVELLVAEGQREAAASAAKLARQELLDKAEWIPDPVRREHFLALPEHADLLALATRLEAAA